MPVYGPDNNAYRLRLLMQPKLDSPRVSIWRRIWAVIW